MSARPPAWDDLQVFLATARARTLAGAAKLVGVNASTVQRRIGKLEADLATRLFDRSQRGYSLTSAGEELLEHVVMIEQEVIAVGRKVGGRDTSLAGIVRVTTVDDLAIMVLSPIVARFRRQHPRVTVEIRVETAFSDLARRQADIAIRFGPRPGGGDIVAKHVAYSHLALYGTRAYLRKHGTPRTMQDLRDHYLVRADDTMAAMPMERVAQRHGDREKVAFRSSSMLVRAAAVRDGIGIGWLARFLADPDPRLVRIEVPDAEFGAHVWMLIHADLRRNARVRAFVDFAHPALIEATNAF